MKTIITTLLLWLTVLLLIGCSDDTTNPINTTPTPTPPDSTVKLIAPPNDTTVAYIDTSLQFSWHRVYNSTLYRIYFADDSMFYFTRYKTIVYYDTVKTFWLNLYGDVYWRVRVMNTLQDTVDRNWSETRHITVVH